MSGFSTERPEIRTENAERRSMSSVMEAAGLLRQIAEPAPVGDKVKAAIGRAYREVKSAASALGHRPPRFSRVEDLWRQEARSVRAEEMDAIRAAHAARNKVRQLADEGAKANAEIADLRARLARLETMLEQVDPDFFGPTRGALREQMGRLR